MIDPIGEFLARELLGSFQTLPMVKLAQQYSPNKKNKGPPIDQIFRNKNRKIELQNRKKCCGIVSSGPAHIISGRYCKMNKRDQDSCNRGIATRGCSGGNGSHEIASRSESEGCGQGVSSRSIYVLLGGRAQGTLETFPACMSVPGYLRVNHRISVLSTALPRLRLERMIRLRWG